MEDHTIIKKLIEREERYMTDAAERQDAEDAQFYKIRKQAFEEVEPFFRQLLDENEQLNSVNHTFALTVGEADKQMKSMRDHVEQMKPGDQLNEPLRPPLSLGDSVDSGAAMPQKTREEQQ